MARANNYAEQQGCSNSTKGLYGERTNGAQGRKSSRQSGKPETNSSNGLPTSTPDNPLPGNLTDDQFVPFPSAPLTRPVPSCPDGSLPPRSGALSSAPVSRSPSQRGQSLPIPIRASTCPSVTSARIAGASAETGPGFSRSCLKWTPEEDAILRDNYRLLGGDVTQLIAGRSRQACHSRARTLRVTLPVGGCSIIGAHKAAAANRENFTFNQSCKPRHVRNVEECSDEWYRRQQQAFCLAMEANPDCRPSGSSEFNGAGSGR